MDRTSLTESEITARDRDLAILQDSAQACFNKLTCCHELAPMERKTIIDRWLNHENDIRILQGKILLTANELLSMHLTHKDLWKIL